jgi:hypothetical protein
MVNDAALSARAEPFDLEHMPKEVLVLTAGADVQDDRIEITICGWIAGRLVAAFEGALPELAAAVAAHTALPQRDALDLLRGSWRTIRARLSVLEAEAAFLPEPELLEAAQ